MAKYGIRFHIALFFVFIIPYYLWLLPYHLTQRYDLWQITAGLSTITILAVGISYFGSYHEKKGLIFELFSFLRFSLKTIAYIGVVTWVGINYQIEIFTIGARIIYYYSTHIGMLLLSVFILLFIIIPFLFQNNNSHTYSHTSTTSSNNSNLPNTSAENYENENDYSIEYPKSISCTEEHQSWIDDITGVSGGYKCTITTEGYPDVVGYGDTPDKAEERASKELAYQKQYVWPQVYHR
jgi:hypothetical protein